MAFFSFSEIKKEVTDVIERKNPCWHIAYIERTLAFGILIFSLFLRYWNVIDLFKWWEWPLWSTEFREFLKNYTPNLFLFWIFLVYIIEPVLRRIILMIQSKKRIRCLPLWYTIENIIDLCFSSILLLFSINIIIEFSYGYTYNSNYFVCLAIAYFLFVFINWVYIKNSNICYEFERNYTNYHDINGKRIAQDDIVVYYGERYNVQLVRGIAVPDRTIETKWILTNSNSNSILLEDAVKDFAGKIFVEEL